MSRRVSPAMVAAVAVMMVVTAAVAVVTMMAVSAPVTVLVMVTMRFTGPMTIRVRECAGLWLHLEGKRCFSGTTRRRRDCILVVRRAPAVRRLILLPLFRLDRRN